MGMNMGKSLLWQVRSPDTIASFMIQGNIVPGGNVSLVCS